MRRRMKNDKGFTLAELLIVVAIIAVLVAVSIPIFTNQLEKSREATDVANFRAAKAAYVVALLDGSMAITNDDTKYYYHADTGLVDTSVPSPYGEGTTKNPYKATSPGEIYPSPYDPASDYTGAVIYAVTHATSMKESVDIAWEGVDGNGADWIENIPLSSISNSNAPKPPATEGNIPTPAP